LNNPASFFQMLVDLIAGNLFTILVCVISNFLQA